jgi:hypothetical protein
MKLTLAVLAAAGMIFCAPAMAQEPESIMPAPVYGPPAPEASEAPADLPPEIANMTADQISAVVRRDRQRRAAIRWHIAFQVLNAADMVQTLVHCGNRPVEQKCEANPLFGRHPSALKIIGLKAASGVFQHIMFRKALRSSPEAGLRQAQVSVLIQGAVVGMNMRVLF